MIVDWRSCTDPTEKSWAPFPQFLSLVTYYGAHFFRIIFITIIWGVWNSGIISWQENPEKLVCHLSVKLNVLKNIDFNSLIQLITCIKKQVWLKIKVIIKINKCLHFLWLFIHICVTLDELTLKCHILSYGPTAYAWYSPHPSTPTPHPGDRNMITLEWARPCSLRCVH